MSTLLVTTLLGAGCVGADGLGTGLGGVALDSYARSLYFATYNSIRTYDLTSSSTALVSGHLTTPGNAVGAPGASRYQNVAGMVVDDQCEYLYSTDTLDGLLRKVFVQQPFVTAVYPRVVVADTPTTLTILGGAFGKCCQQS